MRMDVLVSPVTFSGQHLVNIIKIHVSLLKKRRISSSDLNQLTAETTFGREYSCLQESKD